MTIPGRILVVDNVEDDVKELISEFMKKGENVTYTQPFFEDDNLFRNVRLAILDYFLIEGDLDESLNTISLFINNIYKKTKFFMVAVYSAKITADNGEDVVKKIQENYLKNYKEELPCFLLSPFSKKTLTSANLIKCLETNISKNLDFELLYEIENILDDARDAVVSIVYETGNWSNFVRNLKKEVGSTSINRHVMEIYMNITKRYLNSTSKLESVIKRMLEDAKQIDDKNFGKIFFLQNYYYFSGDEKHWTGDILCSKKNGFAIVLTPECNFAQDTYNAIRIVECEKIDHKDLNKPKILETIKIKFKVNSHKAVINAIFKEKSQLKQNYYSIPFLLDKSTGEFFHLILDFDKTKYLPKDVTLSSLGYSKVCRIDRPLINRIQQCFAVHCSRIGTMTIPLELVDELKKRLP